MALGKTVNQSHIAPQSISTSNTVRSAAVDLSAAMKWALSISLARNSGSAFGSAASAPRVFVYGSAKASGDDDWVPIFEHLMAVGSGIGNTTLSSNASAGATSISMASPTNFLTRDIISIHGSGSTFEVVRADKFTGGGPTTVELSRALGNAYTSGQAVRGQAEFVAPTLDVDGWRRGLIVVENQSSGQSIMAQVIGSLFTF